MGFLDDETKLRIFKVGADAALDHFKQFPRSKTIRESLFVRLRNNSHYSIRTDYFWAASYIEGRQRTRAKNATHLIFFRNRMDDPRLINGQPPKFKSELRTLTKDQFKFWEARNKEAIKGGFPPPMIIVANSPRDAARAVKHDPFFTDHDANLGDIMKPAVEAELDKATSAFLESLGKELVIHL